jgi:hypothetical protein
MFRKKLDYCKEKMEIIQISNDAYYYIVYAEPCLDSENMSEVKELKSRFPYGFILSPSFEPVENSDLVECKIIPICESSSPFTYYKIEGKTYKSEFYYNEDRSRARYRWYDFLHGRFIDYGWNDVKLNAKGKPEIRPKGCVFPLWGKKWLKY